MEFPQVDLPVDLIAWTDVTEDILNIYNPQIEMFARFKMKSSFHKTKRII